MYTIILRSWLQLNFWYCDDVFSWKQIALCTMYVYLLNLFKKTLLFIPLNSKCLNYNSGVFDCHELLILLEKVRHLAVVIYVCLWVFQGVFMFFFILLFVAFGCVVEWLWITINAIIIEITLFYYINYVIMQFLCLLSMKRNILSHI